MLRLNVGRKVSYSTIKFYSNFMAEKLLNVAKSQGYHLVKMDGEIFIETPDQELIKLQMKGND